MSKKGRFYIQIKEIFDNGFALGSMQDYVDIMNDLDKQNENKDKQIAELKQQVAEKDKEIERLKEDLKIEKENFKKFINQKIEVKCVGATEDYKKNFLHQVCEKIKANSLFYTAKIKGVLYAVMKKDDLKYILNQIEKGEE